MIIIIIIYYYKCLLLLSFNIIIIIINACGEANDNSWKNILIGEGKTLTIFQGNKKKNNEKRNAFI